MSFPIFSKSKSSKCAAASEPSPEDSNVTLLFPSLGTGDHEIPCDVATSSLLVALTNHPTLQGHVTMCEPDTSTDMIEKACDIFGMSIHRSDHLNLDSTLALRPRVVVVECNWRFAPNANRLSKAIHMLPCADDCEAPTAARAGEIAGCESASVEGCFPIRVDERHVLRSQHGVEWLIYVRTINLNPNRPDCIDVADRAQIAQASLERTYDAVFQTCSRILSQPNVSRSLKDASTITSSSMEPVSAFGQYSHPGKAQHNSGNWRRALYEIMEKEKQLPKQVFYSNADCVVIYDGFAKADMHLLVLPRASSFHKSVSKAVHLTPRHLEVISRIHDLAYSIAEHLSVCGGGVPVGVGYHAIPSMEPLHIHIVSQDFHSPCLRNKKHWNSFMRPFFIDARQVQLNLESGRAPLSPLVGGPEASDSREAQTLLEAPLLCSTPACNCKRKFPNIPALKQHMSEVFEKRRSQHSFKKIKVGV